MKICFICSEYPPGPHGGIGTLTQILARALVAAGNQVSVLGMYERNHDMPEYEEDRGVGVWRLPAPDNHLGWVTARRLLFRCVADRARHHEIDLVEVPDWQGMAAYWPALNVPVVVRLNGSGTYFAAEMQRSPDRMTFWLERATLRRADFWCSSSRYTAERTQQLFAIARPPDAVLYNPVEFRPAAQGDVRSRYQVVFTGTLVEKKGVRSLIRAWPQVVAACPDAELHLFGKDARCSDGRSMQTVLLEQLRGRAREQIFFHGHVGRERLFKVLRSAWVAVFPSYAEAFAIAPLEAMSAGCPTIYSRRGSGPELIESGVHGLLVDPDEPTEIARSIIRVLKNDRLAERLGWAGFHRVREEFAIDKVVTLNEQFYQRCIDEFQQRRTHPAREVACA